MVSTASHVGRLKHRQQIEREQVEHALAGNEAAYRADLDKKLKAEDDKIYARSPIERTADDVRARDERHQRKRVEGVQKLYSKQDAKRAEVRARHLKEIEAARNAKPTPGKHVPLTEPEKHHPVFTIWKDLDGARRQAILGVYASTATLRDNADAMHVDVSKSQASSRYAKPGSGLAKRADEDLEDKHLEISRSEFGQLSALAHKFEAELEADRRRFEEHAAEREAMMRRHAAENRAHR